MSLLFIRAKIKKFTILTWIKNLGQLTRLLYFLFNKFNYYTVILFLEELLYFSSTIVKMSRLIK